MPLGLSKEIAKRRLCNNHCAIGIVKKRLPKEVCVIIAVPLGLSHPGVAEELYEMVAVP